MRLVLLIGALVSLAPIQCASDPDPARRMEDTAPEALWGLSERFADQGDRDARLETLRHLIERYPNSRYAQRAELELERAGERSEPVSERSP